MSTRPPCGTDGGYHAHRRRGEPQCAPCLRAHSQKSIDYRKGREREKGPKKPPNTCPDCEQRCFGVRCASCAARKRYYEGTMPIAPGYVAPVEEDEEEEIRWVNIRGVMRRAS